jgi:5-methylcytosine-specific restriction endonuclease McrA
VGWQKAIVLWFQGKVEIIEHHELYARSVKESFRLPSIIRLYRFINIRNKPSIRFCRENVYLRDDYTCQYCHVKFEGRDLTMDHVQPVSHGGKKDWKNIVTACRKCNQTKGNRSPRKAKMPLKKNPVKPRWLPMAEVKVTSTASPRSWKVYLSETIHKRR